MPTTIGHLIGGNVVASPTTFESRSSCDQSDLVGVFAAATKDQVREACVAAREAFAGWSATPAPVRGEVLRRVGDALEREKEPLSRLVTREMGKTLKEARGSVQEAIDTCRFFQGEGRRLYGQTVPSEMPNKELTTYRRPLGVVGMVTASNFPIAVPSWKIVPALLTGNTVVWKPSSDASAVAYAFAKLFEEAGVPPGVLNVVFGGGRDAGAYLIDMMDEGRLNKFAFTGSTAVGRVIGEVAGRNLLHPTLELGGKNPLVVLRDADLENAVQGAVFSAFATGGQRCTSAGNIIVDEPIYDAFVERFLAQVAELRIGNPVKHEDVYYGPFINERFFKDWQEHYGWGDTDGATLAYGHGRITSESAPSGWVGGDPAEAFYGWPTVWTGVEPGMRLFQEEVFGPTINLVKVNGVDAAIDAANAVEYGLSSAVYTMNREWAYQFKSRIEAGMTSINNTTVGAEAHLPFGGVKSSGNGTRESGIWVLESYTYWHAVNDDVSGRLQLAQMETAYVTPSSESVDVAGLF